MPNNNNVDAKMEDALLGWLNVGRAVGALHISTQSSVCVFV